MSIEINGVRLICLIVKSTSLWHRGFPTNKHVDACLWPRGVIRFVLEDTVVVLVKEGSCLILESWDVNCNIIVILNLKLYFCK